MTTNKIILNEKQKKEAAIKQLLDSTTNYKPEHIQMIQDNFLPSGDKVILKINVIAQSKSGLILSEPKVSTCATIIKAGSECKVAKDGMKAILHIPSIGNIGMYTFKVNGKDYVCLMESQLTCVYPSNIELLEEEDFERPETKAGDDMAFLTEKIDTDLRLPN